MKSNFQKMKKLLNFIIIKIFKIKISLLDFKKKY